MSGAGIPTEAIVAAHAAICEQNLDDCMDPEWRGKCVKAVEAAAPHILAPAFDEGVKAGADYRFKLAHSIEHDTPEEPCPIINPYRSQA